MCEEEYVATTESSGVAVEGPLVSRMFTTAGEDPFETVEWGVRDARAGDFFQAGVEAPVAWSDDSVGVVAKLYLTTIAGVKETSVRQMVHRVARAITEQGIVQGHFEWPDRVVFVVQDGLLSIEPADLPSDDPARAFYDEIVYTCLHQLACFNTPVWLNCGVPGRHQALHACFLLNVEDKMLGDDGIVDWWRKEAIIFKGGGGSGVNLFKLRSSKERLSTGGYASGPVSYMRAANANAETLKSGGVHRRAAKFVCLNDDHPDIRDFVACKVREDQRMVDLAEAGHDLSIFTPEGERNVAEVTSFQSSNNSVCASDAFMRAVEEDDDWELTARTTGEVVETIRARELMREIADAAWRCADPGMIFIDTINRAHTTPSLGPVTTTNTCLVGDTLVDTLDGLVTIRELARAYERGDELPEAFGFDIDSSSPRPGQILQASMTRVVEDVVRVSTVGGIVIDCTPEHEVLCLGERGYFYQPASSLVEGDDICAINHYAGRVSDRVLWVEHIDLLEPVEVFDITVEGIHNFGVATDGVGHSIVVANCGEITQNDDTACNLASLNLLKFIGDAHEHALDIDKFCHVVDVMLTAQDIIDGFSELPTARIERNTRDLRQCGLGLTNLGASLMSLGLPYGSSGARRFSSSVAALLTARSWRQSAVMASKLGAFERYEDNSASMTEVIDRFHQCVADSIRSSDSSIWTSARDAIVEARYIAVGAGYRNAQVTSMMPCGTTSFMMGAETTGIEPVFSLVTNKKLAAAGEMVLTSPSAARAARLLGYDDAYVQAIAGGDVSWAIDEDKAVFATAVGPNPIEPMGHLRMVAAMQPYVTQAISKTVNVPNDTTVDEILELYMEAWRMGVKSISVYRDGSKATQVLTAASTSKESAPPMPDEPETEADQPSPTRRRLPRTCSSIRHKIHVRSSLGEHEGYIQAGLYPDGTLGEVFLEGFGRMGGFVQNALAAFATTLSISLQYGVPFEVLVRKFVGHSDETGGVVVPDPGGEPLVVRSCDSLVDYVARWLVSRFGDVDLQEELGVMTDAVKERMIAATESHAGVSHDVPLAWPTANGHRPEVDISAHTCPSCLRPMQRSGTCLRCPACGHSSGACG